MLRRGRRAGEMWLVSTALLLACSATNPHVRVRRTPEGYLQVEGPLAGPFGTLEALAQNACDIVLSQPGAMNGPYGFEYCALYYYSAKDQAFFLSYLSDLSSNYPDGTKSCTLPRSLSDASHPDAIILGGSHNHPHNRRFSAHDLSSRVRWRPTRIADSTGKVWERSTMLFYRENSGTCSSYLFNNQTLAVSALREGQWVEIGSVYNDRGDIQLREGMGWVP